MKKFPLEKFRNLFPIGLKVDDETLEAVAEMALCYLNKCGGCFEQLWMLMVAHMLKLRDNENSGQVSGVLTGATIDKVSVSLAAPPTGSSAEHWFNLTPYGTQFLALNKRCGGVGFYVGGMPERSAFRSVGGRFPRGGRSW